MSYSGFHKFSLSVGLVLAGLGTGAWASETPKEVGAIRSVQITEIHSIKKLSENVGTSPMDAKLEVEITGIYEGNAQMDNIVGRIETTRSGGEQISGELKLFSVDTKPTALKFGGGFVTAVSNPTPFRVVVTLSPNMWSPSGNAFFAGPQTGMMWDMVAKVRKYQPVQYEHSYGFSASLFHSPQRKSWNFYVFGLDKP